MSQSSTLIPPHSVPTGQDRDLQPAATRIPPAQNNARSLLLRYGVALVSAALAVLLREALTPLWGDQLPFLTLFPAVFLSAWYGSLGPGLVTTILCTLAAAYLWLAPFYSLTAHALADQVGLVLAVLVMLLITWLTAALRRTQEQLVQQVHQVQARTVELTQANTNLRDEITARKQAEEAVARHARELERANTDLRQIAYIAAHDLQEPVRQVGIYTQKITERYRDSFDPATGEAAGFIVEGTQRMIAQFNDLMHYLEVDEANTERITTDCEVVLQRALMQLHESIATSSATITHDPLPTIKAHPAHLQLVFQELLDNAVKFRTTAPPQIHVWAEHEERGWRFAVRDHGISIDPQYYGRLFGLFKRVERDRYPGTGMGLAICRKIVERHGGGIWLEPTPGGGVTVTFTISDVREERRN